MSKKQYIWSKILLLREFCILRKGDPREQTVRNILTEKANEVQIDNFLHDILNGNKTLNEAIGVM